MMMPMSVVRILAISVEEGLGEGVEHLLGARALAYQNQAGFERLELLEPTDGRSTWLFVTRWVDEASYSAFMGSPTFTDHDLADRIATFAAPESVTGEVWNYRVALDSSP
jgi:heme-degrading monooxygenase HmoA